MIGDVGTSVREIEKFSQKTAKIEGDIVRRRCEMMFDDDDEEVPVTPDRWPEVRANPFGWGQRCGGWLGAPPVWWWQARARGGRRCR